MRESPQRLLVVDDELRSARLLVRLLKDDGFLVELAADGAAAIGRLSRPPIPDALITDYRMPHADGLAVARYARSRRPRIPVFFVTGYPSQVPPVTEQHESTEDTDTRIFPKPLVYGDLAAALRRVLTQP